MRRTLLILVLTLILPTVIAGNVSLERDYNSQITTSNTLVIKLNISTTSQADVAEFIPLQFKLLNWTASCPVQFDKKMVGDRLVLHFKTNSSCTISYTLLPTSSGEYEFTSILTSLDSVKKETFPVKVLQTYNFDFVYILVFLLLLGLLIKVTSK